jgi:hypothetical protein
MNKGAGGDQDRLSRQRYPGALGHHAEENREVSVASDQGKYVSGEVHVSR